MPRAIWSGSISFGLVSAPVRMYSAIAEEDIHFHLVHATDGAPIGYRKVCKAEGREVPAEEIVKAYEWAKGDLVILTDEDLAAADPEATRELRILDFVPYEDIDPIHFERTYHLGPAEGGERVYALLATAMADAGLAAIGRYVFHDKEHLAALRVRDGVITLERMYFAGEVRSAEGIAPEGTAVDDGELEMARKLIAAYAGAFDIGKYEDTHRDRVMAIIEAKHRGHAVEAPAPSRPDAPPDLMQALRASLAAMGGDGDGRDGTDRDGRDAAGGDGEDLDALTVDELRRRAKAAEVRGYSKMKKAELLGALAEAA